MYCFYVYFCDRLSYNSYMKGGINMENNIRNAIDVSRYIINECHKQNLSISNLKLQKLLYFAQGYSLALTDTPLFYNEIEAWDFGPVVPEVYREYKMFGANEIPVIDSYYDIDFDSEDFLSEIKFDDNIFNGNQKLIMNAVVKQFGKFTANDLVNMTHKQSPWKDSYKIDKNISKDKIKTFFNQYRMRNS